MTKSVINTDILVLGSGPAGLSAAIYSTRSCLSTIVISGMEAGGQLNLTTDVENYPGFSNVIQGPWLMKEMKSQAITVGAEIIDDEISKIDLKTRIAHGTWGAVYQAKAIVIATGAQAKWLGIESESVFQGFGVSGCATCDAFFFKNKIVSVIGGGNTAVEEALYLTNHASYVYLIHRREQLRADQILQQRLFNNKKIKVIWDNVVEEIFGTDEPKAVNGIKLRNVNDNKLSSIDCEGVFIAIGHSPNTSLFSDQLLLDKEGYIVTEPDSTKTSMKYVFAAGDVQDKIYRQAVTAAATGCMAALEAEKLIRSCE
ncbi:thioredoxin-disulfide reductase [Rickettsia endosymbiont of Cardiosporidium cionae]|uniref:thioredoxin-disulfide reductase n=1 Tax=Rickettsia endosymbiont of Cardiosporidium cionae TaxID=2777155 RepID=UPI001894EB97|nr:thioredoxin-disulfide reductase [Rickettsia endosymbiont of Cardiosporidium cionae]KAF8818930.1 thioredoxin-disulfide reductase [Rickettsia endosymbiont of Cardiosporidium cionae]